MTTDTGRRYWAVTDKDGSVSTDADQAIAYKDWNKAHAARGFLGICNGHAITEVAIIPAADYAALCAIRDAAKTLVEGGAVTPESDCEWCGQQASAVTWMNDYKALKTTLDTPAGLGDHRKGEME